MTRKPCFLLPAILLLSSTVFAETLLVKPTVVQSAVLPKASFVHAITSVDGNTGILSSAPQNPQSRSWLQLENGKVVCSLEVPVPPRVPVAVDEKRIVWASSSTSGTRLTVLTPQTGDTKTFDISLKGIHQLALVGSDVFAISAQGRHPMHLHQVSLENGRLSYLNELVPERAAISFGQSAQGRLVLIDNAQGRFREDKTGEKYAAGTWKRIEAPILETARNAGDIGLGPNIVRSLILQHWLTRSGNHGFVVTVQSNRRGQFAIETDSEGKELRQWQLDKWMAKASESGHLVNFPMTTFAGIGSLQWTGDFAIYDALR